MIGGLVVKMVAVRYFGGTGVRAAIGGMLMLSLLIIPLPVFSSDDVSNSADDSTAVMEIFNEQAIAEQEAFELSDNEKHQILFVMGIALLVLLGATAYFGIAMGVGGKDVFVPHMISAGLAITLSLAHAVTAIVWFYPF